MMAALSGHDTAVEDSMVKVLHVLSDTNIGGAGSTF